MECGTKEAFDADANRRTSEEYEEARTVTAQRGRHCFALLENTGRARLSDSAQEYIPAGILQSNDLLRSFAPGTAMCQEWTSLFFVHFHPAMRFLTRRETVSDLLFRRKRIIFREDEFVREKVEELDHPYDRAIQIL
jgi:hypothetical protein